MRIPMPGRDFRKLVSLRFIKFSLENNRFRNNQKGN